MKIDLNCDLGEETGTDAAIMPFISSANIACGLHAGNTDIIKQTIEQCLIHDVAIGAHPSWPDRTHFGRRNMQMSPSALFNCITEQLYTVQTIAERLGTSLHHVKPHGALYNQSASDAAIAHTIADAVFQFNASLILYGLSGSLSLSEAASMSLRTAHEVFADRAYMPNGTLMPRSEPGAVITNSQQVAAQAIRLAKSNAVTTTTGQSIILITNTICLHGDTANAIQHSKAVYEALTANNIRIEPI